MLRRARRTLALLALVSLLAAPALAPTLPAHQGDGRPHVQPFQEVRDVTTEVTPAGVTFTLTRPSEPLADVVRMRFDGKTGELLYEYREDGARAETAFAFRVILDALVEYGDRNTNGRYDPSADTQLREYPMRTMRWNVTEAAPLGVGQGAQKQVAEHVVANGTIGVTGAFRIQFIASGHQVNLAASRMHPQDVKMIWNVANFPFSRPDSRLALVARVVTEPGTTTLQERNADGVPTGVVMRTEDRMAFFDWADFAIGNSTGEPPERKVVLAHVHDPGPSPDASGGEERLIVYSYPRTDFLLSHDPTLGLEYAPPERPPLLGFNPGWFLGAVALAGVVSGGWWYARKGGRDRVREWVGRR